MAQPGDTLEGAGSRLRFIETAATTGGQRVVVESAYHGDGAKPPPHFHPAQQELFTVLEGEAHALVDGERHDLHVGDELVIAPGAVHTMWADVPTVLRWETSPALRTEAWFETMWPLQRQVVAAAAGEGPAPDVDLAALLHDFADVIRFDVAPA